MSSIYDIIYRTYLQNYRIINIFRHIRNVVMYSCELAFMYQSVQPPAVSCCDDNPLVDHRMKNDCQRRPLLS